MPAANRILTLNLGSQTIALGEFRAQAGGGLVLHNFRLQFAQQVSSVELEASVNDSRWDVADTHMQGTWGRTRKRSALRVVSSAMTETRP